MVAPIFNSSSLEAEACGSVKISGYPGLHSKLQTIQGCTGRLCLKIKTKQAKMILVLLSDCGNREGQRHRQMVNCHASTENPLESEECGLPKLLRWKDSLQHYGRASIQFQNRTVGNKSKAWRRNCLEWHYVQAAAARCQG